jgi:alkyl hydroperoxide reductase subunit F
MYDLVIIGGGPAGAAAAVYAARKQLQTALVVEDWGGQSAVSSEVQNWIGTTAISGADLADALKKHVETYAGAILDIKRGERAQGLAAFDDHVEIVLAKGEKIEAKSALVASGATRRALDIPGAKEYDQKGLTYCASCDGPLFADKDVAVIGGGNAGFETALQLLAYCKTVTLLNRGETFRADEISVASALAHPNMKTIMNAEPLEVIGSQFVSGLRYKDSKTGVETTLPVEGIFVEIGLLPNTAWVGDALAKNKIGQIVVDPKTQKTSHPRVWAAGDCTDGLYHQNNIAAGDAVKALEDIYLFLRKGSSEI